MTGRGEGNGTGGKTGNDMEKGGGGATQIMEKSLGSVLREPQVESVFINGYGGMTSGRQVAHGMLDAMAALGGVKPIVVRFDGNEAREGLDLLDKAGGPGLHVCDTMEEAADLAAQLAAAAKEARR